MHARGTVGHFGFGELKVYGSQRINLKGPWVIITTGVILKIQNRGNGAN